MKSRRIPEEDKVRKRKCYCFDIETCSYCRRLFGIRDYLERKEKGLEKVSDEELENRLVRYFVMKGWDN